MNLGFKVGSHGKKCNKIIDCFIFKKSHIQRQTTLICTVLQVRLDYDKINWLE